MGNTGLQEGSARAMEQRECGHSGLTLSVLGLGCWSFGGGEYWGPCRAVGRRRRCPPRVRVGHHLLRHRRSLQRRTERDVTRAGAARMPGYTGHQRVDHPSSLLGLEFVQHAAHECAQLRSRHGLEGPDEIGVDRLSRPLSIHRRTMDSNPPSLKLPRAGPATACAQGKLGRLLKVLILERFAASENS